MLLQCHSTKRRSVASVFLIVLNFIIVANLVTYPLAQTFWVSGSCPYGKRCCFIHTELPASGVAPGADGAPPPKISHVDGRPRSGSTNSDPTEGSSTSLLARLKRGQDASANSSTSTTPASAVMNSRPTTLKLDTSVATVPKQNKSAYPTYAHNGILMPTVDDGPSMSPGPVTAAPDFGRHAAARNSLVGTQVHSPLILKHVFDV